MQGLHERKAETLTMGDLGTCWQRRKRDPKRQRGAGKKILFYRCCQKSAEAIVGKEQRAIGKNGGLTP